MPFPHEVRNRVRPNRRQRLLSARRAGATVASLRPPAGPSVEATVAPARVASPAQVAGRDGSVAEIADDAVSIATEISEFMQATQAEVIGCWRERAATIETVHILLALRENGPLNISGLAHLRGVSLPNASCIVDRLEERRLVERVRDLGDRRVVSVRIAPAGEALLEAAETVRSRALVLVLEAMPPEERPGFARAVRAFGAAYRTLAASGGFHDLVSGSDTSSTAP